MRGKTFTPEDVKKLIEEVRKYLQEDPEKGWLYIQWQKLTEEERAVLQAVWPTLKGWQKDSELLQQGMTKFGKKLQPQLDKIWRNEIKKRCKELFGE